MLGGNLIDRWKSEKGEDKIKDRKQFPFFYGWIVLALSFLGLFATFGVRGSFGAYIIAWQHEFNVSRTVIMIISTVSFITFALFQPISGRLNDWLGGRFVFTSSLLLVGASLILASAAKHPWQLVLLYGVAASIGLAGGSNVTATSIITSWFVARRGFAMGLTLSGMALGQLVMVPFSLLLVQHYGWRASMTTIGLLLLVLFAPLAYLFLRAKPEDVGLLALGATAGSEIERDKPAAPKRLGSIFAMFRDVRFWYLTLPYFVCGFTDVGLIDTHFIPFAQGRGIPVSVIAFAFSTIALFNIFGTIGTGYLSDRLDRSKQLAGIYVLRSLTFILLLTTRSTWWIFLFAGVYGATEMASIAPTSALCADMFKKYPIGTVFGLVSVSHQLGGAVGSLVPGVVFDSFGSYAPVIALSILLLWASAVMVSRIVEPRQFVQVGAEALVVDE